MTHNTFKFLGDRLVKFYKALRLGCPKVAHGLDKITTGLNLLGPMVRVPDQYKPDSCPRTVTQVTVVKKEKKLVSYSVNLPIGPILFQVV